MNERPYIGNKNFPKPFCLSQGACTGVGRDGSRIREDRPTSRNRVPARGEMLFSMNDNV